jgi:hypothetical protein
VGLSSVVGGEGAWGASEVDVDVRCEGESEESLGDALHEPSECFGEVIFQARLMFEVGEHALDDERMRAFETSPRGRGRGRWRSGVMSWISISSMQSWYSLPQKPLSANGVLPACAAASCSASGAPECG